MDDYSYSGEATAAFVAIYVGFLVFYLLLALASYIVMSLALSSFFRKVGVEPYIAWIPVYNYWKWLEVGGQSGWLSLLLFVPVGNYVTLVFLYIGMYRTGLAFRKDGAFVVLGIFLPFVWAFILGGKTAVYEPGLLAAHGYPPPLAGFGSVPAAARTQGQYAGQPQAGQPYAGQPYQPPVQPQPPQYGTPPQYGEQQPPVPPQQPPVPPVV
jgi:hypothetical protein